MRLITLLLSAFALIAFATGSNPSVEEGLTTIRSSKPRLPTIYGLTSQNSMGSPPELVILKAAIDLAGLRGVLDARRPKKTAFGPTDAAFIKLARALGYRGRDKTGAVKKILEFLKFASRGKPIMLLKKILQYHVVVGAAVTKREAVKLGTIKTALGVTIHVRRDGTLVDKAPGVPDPKIVIADTPASNGIAHVIDGVLLPFPVADLIKKFLGRGRGRRRRRKYYKRRPYYKRPYYKRPYYKRRPKRGGY